MKVLISMHDVSPVFEKELEVVQKEFESFEVAYLVTPHWHSKAMITRGFISQFQGKEIILHGLTHVGSKDLLSSLMFANKELRREFLGLNKQETFDRIARAKQLMEDNSGNVSGFIPPMWYHNSYSEEALTTLGFLFTERFSALKNLKTGTTLKNIPMTFDFGNNKLLSRSSLFLNRINAQYFTRPVIRLAIHPNDVKHGYLSLIKDIVSVLKEQKYTFTSYKQLLNL